MGKTEKGKEISNSGTPRALNKRMEIGHEDEDEDDWDQNFLPQDSIDPKRKEELIGISNSNSSRTITDASHALGSSGLRLTSNSHQNSNSRDQQNKLSHSRSQSSTSTTSTNTSTQSGKSLALTDISGRLARQSDVSSWRTRRSSGSEEGNDDLDLSLSADLERRPISWNTNGSGSGSGGNGSEGSKTGDERLGWPASLNPVNREEKSEGNRNSQRSSTSGQTDALRWEMGIPLDGERRSWGSNALRDDLMEIGDEEEEGVPRPISGVNGSLRQRSSQTSWTGEEPTRRHALYVSADGAGATGSGSDTESAPSLNGESGDETETESALGLSDVLQSGKRFQRRKPQNEKFQPLTIQFQHLFQLLLPPQPQLLLLSKGFLQLLVEHFLYRRNYLKPIALLLLLNLLKRILLDQLILVNSPLLSIQSQFLKSSQMLLLSLWALMRRSQLHLLLDQKLVGDGILSKAHDSVEVLLQHQRLPLQLPNLN